MITAQIRFPAMVTTMTTPSPPILLPVVASTRRYSSAAHSTSTRAYSFPPHRFLARHRLHVLWHLCVFVIQETRQKPMGVLNGNAWWVSHLSLSSKGRSSIVHRSVQLPIVRSALRLPAASWSTQRNVPIQVTEATTAMMTAMARILMTTRKTRKRRERAKMVSPSMMTGAGSSGLRMAVPMATGKATRSLSPNYRAETKARTGTD